MEVKGMEIKLYKTLDDNNKINKQLDDEVVYDIVLKNSTNIYKPTIILKTNSIIKSNYAYLSEFDRYYYIEDVTVTPNELYSMDLRCDVLMSFKDDILNSEAYIEQSTSSNPYYNSGYESEVKKEIDIFKSSVDNGSMKQHNILVTISGSGT